MVAAGQKKTAGWRKALRLVRKTLLWVLTLALLAVLLVVAGLLMPPGREFLLKKGLEIAGDHVPGDITAQHLSWPDLGRVRLEGVVWIVPDTTPDTNADTLASLDHLELQFDVTDLMDRRLGIRRLDLSSHRLNLPGILQNLPASADPVRTLPDTASPAPVPYFNEGSWPGLPAVYLDTLTVVLRQVTVGPQLSIDVLQLHAGLDLRPENPSRAWIRRTKLAATVHAQTLLPVSLDQLEIEASTARGQGLAHGVNLEVDGLFTLPGPALWPRLSGETMDLGSQLLPLDQPCRGHLNARAEIAADLKEFGPEDVHLARIRLNLGQTEWLEQGLFSTGFTRGQATLDTLAIELLGLELLASGAADSSNVQLELATELAQDSPLFELAGPAYADYRGSGRLEAVVDGPWRRPDLELMLQAAAATPEAVIPDLKVQAKARGDSLMATVAIGPQATLGTVALDTLAAHWRTARPDTLDLRMVQRQHFELLARTTEGEMTLGGWSEGDTLRAVQIDSLNILVLQKTIQLAQPAVFTYGLQDRSFSVSEFKIIGEPGYLKLGGQYSPEGVDLDADWDLLFTEALLQELAPSEMWSREGGLDIALNGKAALNDSPDGPLFEGGFRTSVVPHRDEPPLTAEAAFRLAGGDTAGLAADLQLEAGDLVALHGRALWPGSADLSQGTWVPDPDQGPFLEFPEQDIDLSTFKPLLPKSTGIEGLLGLGLRLDLNEDRTGQLQGRVHTGEVRVELPNNSRVRFDLDCRIEGSAIDPKVTGQVNVPSGFIRIPEIPRNLLPVEGESLLWTAMATELAVDSLAAAELPAEQGPVIQPKGAVYLPDLDVAIHLPSGLIIHGYGLNIDVEGQLKVTRGYGPDGLPGPALTGHLGIHEGSLQFMNRLFDFTHVEILFRGLVPSNPRLDVNLESEVSGYMVRIEIRGTGLEPDITLTSEPELKQADIMSLLLFGQTSTDLDSDQRGRMQEENSPGQQLQQNLAALAMVFGTSGMQNSMSSTLGVDMVEFGSDSEGDSTLMVGKFLTPRILVKYHQSLEKSGTYFMTLDYSLNKFFKLVSTYGQGEEDSGLEIKWTRRY